MTGPAPLPRQRLQALGRLDDGAVPLAETSLWLAALVRPGAGPPARHLDILAELADDLRAACGPGLEEQAGAVAALFGRRSPFRVTVDEDEDGDDADLMAVIDRRAGDAATLGLVMVDVARRAGLHVEALDFPCRLLLRLATADGRRMILDPASGARPVDPPELRAVLKAERGLDHELEPGHFDPLGNRALIVRVQTGIKLRLLRLGRLDRALALVEGLLLVAPDLPLLWREAGLMHLRRGNPRAALAALEQFVARTQDSYARARALTLMADLKSRPH